MEMLRMSGSTQKAYVNFLLMKALCAKSSSSIFLNTWEKDACCSISSLGPNLQQNCLHCETIKSRYVSLK